jgi:hypothetical protein
VLLTSGNFGLVKIPMLLLFMGARVESQPRGCGIVSGGFFSCQRESRKDPARRARRNRIDNAAQRNEDAVAFPPNLDSARRSG